MGSLETAVSTLEQLSNNNPAQNSGIDILRAGSSEQRFGVEIPELDLDFETFRIDGTRRLAALVGTTALIAGVGAGTSVSEAAVPSQYASTVTCPNPYINYQFYRKDFPSRPASAGSDLVILSNDQYAIPSPTVLNNYACVGQESKAEFGIENVGPESAQGSTITVSMGSPDAGIHIDRLVNPNTKEPLANCQIDPNSQSLTCNLGDLAMYGMAYAEAQYHADPLTGSQGPKASSIVASVQSSVTENYPADNQITHQFNIYDQMGVIATSTPQPDISGPKIPGTYLPPKIYSRMFLGNCVATDIVIRVPRTSSTVYGFSYRLLNKGGVVFRNLPHRPFRNVLKTQLGNVGPGKVAMDSLVACFKKKKISASRLDIKAQNAPKHSYKLSFNQSTHRWKSVPLRNPKKH